MAERELTERERQVLDGLERDLHRWVERNAIPLDGEVGIGMAIERMREVAERWNSMPREERITTYANMCGRDPAEVLEEVADVTYSTKLERDEHGAPTAHFVSNIQLIRPVEQVFVTFAIGDRDATN